MSIAQIRYPITQCGEQSLAIENLPLEANQARALVIFKGIIEPDSYRCPSPEWNFDTTSK
jgi:hypothetical protein